MSSNTTKHHVYPLSLWLLPSHFRDNQFWNQTFAWMVRLLLLLLLRINCWQFFFHTWMVVHFSGRWKYFFTLFWNMILLLWLPCQRSYQHIWAHTHTNTYKPTLKWPCTRESRTHTYTAGWRRKCETNNQIILFFPTNSVSSTLYLGLSRGICACVHVWYFLQFFVCLLWLH